eukprot:8972825-Heterocapsa_arctica.AAC.1
MCIEKRDDVIISDLINNNAKNNELVVDEVIGDEDRRGHGDEVSCSTGRCDGRDDRSGDNSIPTVYVKVV